MESHFSTEKGVFGNLSLKLQSSAIFFNAKSSNMINQNDIGFCLLSDIFFRIKKFEGELFLIIFYKKKHNGIQFFYRKKSVLNPHTEMARSLPHTPYTKNTKCRGTYIRHLRVFMIPCTIMVLVRSTNAIQVYDLQVSE